MAPQLRLVELPEADQLSVQQKHWNLQPEAPPQGRVGIDIHDGEWRQLQLVRERHEFRVHFIAQAAVCARQQLQYWQGQRCGGAPSDSPGAGGLPASGSLSSALSELAMTRTVSGGTSPTAVT